MLTSEHIDHGIDIPAAYLLSSRDPYSAPPRLDWWRGFGSKELTNLMQEAQAANLDIAAAMARVVQADAAAKVAGSALFPLITFNGSDTRSRPSAASGTNVIGVTDRTLYNASFSASYEIDFWGKNREALRAAEENAAAMRYAQDVVGITTLAATANAYFQLVGAQDQLRVARENLRSATEILNLIKERLTVGTASSLNVAQQESLVASQRAAIPPLEETARQNAVTLALLIGRPPETVRVHGGSLYQLSLPSVTTGLPSDLLVQRPDIRVAEANLVSAEANVAVARAMMLPSIQFSGQGGFQSALIETLFTPEAAFYSVAGSLTQPIFDGARLLGTLEQQQGRQVELLQNYRKAILQGFTDVENALIAREQTAKTERLQRDVVASSRRAFQISQQLLREGTIDLVTLLQTEQTLFQAETSLAAARLARFIAMVSLYQALGGGWTPRPLTRTADTLQ